MGPIEQLSLEAWIAETILSSIIIVLFIVRVAAIAQPKLIPIIDNFTAPIVSWLHRGLRPIPYILAALIIAIIAPIVELYMDSYWLCSQIDCGVQNGGVLSNIWGQALVFFDGTDLQKNIVHAMQWLILFVPIWFGLTIANWMIVMNERAAHDRTENFQKLVFLAFVFGALRYLANVNTWIGQHPESLGIFPG